MSYRSKILSSKINRQEQELRIITNPVSNPRLRLFDPDDYQAPLTARTLAPNSKWILVRNNLHKIRSWRPIQTPDPNDPFAEWYLFFQMRRELRRIKQHIQEVDNRPDFAPVRYFYLPIDERHTRRYDVSHVQPSDALFYPGFGVEPFMLRSLFYYFSVESPVPHNSLLRIFLTDVCSIVNRNERYLHRLAVLRKLASIIALIVFIIIGIMFFTLIFSALKTIANFHKFYASNPNGDLEWQSLEATLNSF